MKCYDFDWQINEFMVYCRSTQLRERTMYSYEQTLRLFERWLCDELKIYSVDKVTENMIRKYINDLQERGKYTFFVNDLSKVKNYPERRRDYRKPVSVTTINNYIRNLRVFFRASSSGFAFCHAWLPPGSSLPLPLWHSLLRNALFKYYNTQKARRKGILLKPFWWRPLASKEGRRILHSGRRSRQSLRVQ